VHGSLFRPEKSSLGSTLAGAFVSIAADSFGSIGSEYAPSG